MLKKMVFPGKYIQGAGALNELPSLVNLFGGQGVIIASPTVYERVLPESNLDVDALSLPVERFGGECCEQELSRVAALIREKRVDVLVAMGGGKTIDTAKIAADRAAIAVIVVPTIASTDAPCSGCAVLYSEEGVFERVYYQKLNPAAVLVDTEIIARAPVRFLVAGMGDVVRSELLPPDAVPQRVRRTGHANRPQPRQALLRHAAAIWRHRQDRGGAAPRHTSS